MCRLQVQPYLQKITHEHQSTLTGKNTKTPTPHTKKKINTSYNNITAFTIQLNSFYSNSKFQKQKSFYAKTALSPHIYISCTNPLYKMDTYQTGHFLSRRDNDNLSLVLLLAILNLPEKSLHMRQFQLQWPLMRFKLLKLFYEI